MRRVEATEEQKALEWKIFETQQDFQRNLFYLCKKYLKDDGWLGVEEVLLSLEAMKLRIMFGVFDLEEQEIENENI